MILIFNLITLQNNVFFSGLFIGQHFINIHEVDSTNNYLKNLISNSKPVPEGTVIMAENQFAGRGQRENKWVSDPGKNLLISILLNPTFIRLTDQFDLTRIVSLGITGALQQILGNELKIKWPNDIYYGNKKLGGVLIENVVQGNVIKHSVVGIGLNVNQQQFPGTLPNAVSMTQILQQDYDLKFLLSQICRHLEAWYLQLKAGRKDFVRKSYLERLYLYNEEGGFKAGGQKFNGRITGVESEGKLVVDTKAGAFTFDLKEIEFLNNN
jgi:BirA family biotin operon repressor/biotin-[acetyl-CoA-carboxylase] ligase